MDSSDDVEQSSSQELPLSQETFTFIWTQIQNDVCSSGIMVENDYSDIMENDILKSKEETVASRNCISIPSSSSASPMHYTHLNAPSKAASSYQPSQNPEYTVVEFCAEDPPFPHGSRNLIPPNTDWPGPYDFQVSFQSQERIAKSTFWTYSEAKKKLYINMAVACPVHFILKTQPPPGTVIRAMTIFSMPEHITDIVKRCLNHSSPRDPLNDGHPAPDHLVRCDNPSSKYVEDYNTKRQSVITDYEPPQVGMEYSVYMYRFMCLGSCVGGLNRRPLQLIFTLEKDGQCLGRKVMDLRICACPGRDMRTEEKYLEKTNARKRGIICSTTTDTVSGPSLKRSKSGSGDEESSYSLTVYRRSHYDILKKVANALELADLASLLTAEETAALQHRYIKCKRKRQQQSSEENST